jgi:hypothetical protein
MEVSMASELPHRPPFKTYDEYDKFLMRRDRQAQSAYVASRFLNRELVKNFTAKLLTANPPIYCIQTWPDEQVGTDPALCAAVDLDQIDWVPTVIVLTQDCEKTPGGMNFEAGYAVAKGKRVIVIGPRVNVFYHLFPPTIEHYDTIQDFFTSLGDAWTK